MTTLGVHPFIPGPFKLGSVPACQCCPNDACHPVHDWLTINAVDRQLETFALSAITPEEMVQLPNLLTADGGR